MDGKTPIKRSKELAHLSREHHDGLLFVWKIRQGIKKGVPAEKVSEFARWYWHHHLAEHFRKEEEVLAPALPSNEPLVSQMISEHQTIRQQILSVITLSELNLLATQVNDHIRFEERVLFPHAEKLLSPEELTKIEEGLKESPSSCPAWVDEFWLS